MLSMLVVGRSVASAHGAPVHRARYEGYNRVILIEETPLSIYLCRPEKLTFLSSEY